ncbi:hypothetical protein GIB67_021308 [Kingdonia uniflora]|uniref:Cytochrome P450 n=1 Tax=Kingdonia uniflora TaxID=39325 RepID=A0A7J7LY20_9MAGN|nr:hypothetical protein GIB67_021308 [Kingdonia uniflora]
MVLEYLFLFISVLLLSRFYRDHRSKKLNLPPSPSKLPIIGNMHQLGEFSHNSFLDLSQKYGKILLVHLAKSPWVIISSPEIAREIMKTHDNEFANRPVLTAANIFFYGYTDVSFAPNNEYWRQVRKLFVQELLNAKMILSFKYVREEEMTLVIENISYSCSSQTPVNLSEIVLTFTNNLVCRCSISTKSKEGNSRFGELSRDVVTLMSTFSFQDFSPALGWIDSLTGLRKKVRSLHQEIDTYFEKVIEEHVSKSQQNGSKKDILDLLLHGQVEYGISRDNIKALLMDIFVGGTETAATAMEWSMAELMIKPHLMKKAQEEVRRVVGTKSHVSEEDIHQMEYLRCVIKEVLRLHPPISMLVPRVSYTTANVLGYDIPANTIVLINAYAIQRDPELWENAEEFIPERFSNDNNDFRGQDYKFMPFGSGRRTCPGMGFAIIVVETVVANLLFHFDWKLPSDVVDLDMGEAPGMNVNRRIPLHLVPVSRSTA